MKTEICWMLKVGPADELYRVTLSREESKGEKSYFVSVTHSPGVVLERDYPHEYQALAMYHALATGLVTQEFLEPYGFKKRDIQDSVHPETN